MNNLRTLELDKRQQAMLEAMGIRQWINPENEQKTAAGHTEYAQAAPKIIANKPLKIARSAATSADHAHAADLAEAADATQTLDTDFHKSATQTVPLAQHGSSGSSASPTLRTRPTPPAHAHPAQAAPTTAAILLQPLPEGITQMDWAALQTAVSSCQACSLCATRTQTVFGAGAAVADKVESAGAAEGATLAPQVDWLIVGEAPGENEDLQGEPFVGQAGKLLDNMLRSLTVNGQRLGRQHNVFITNALKCRPPANRNPSADEMALCQPYLQRQIALLQPKIILAMGRFAMQALLGSSEPLGKLRGRLHILPNGICAAPVVVTYHPAYLLRNLPDKAKAWQDLLLAVAALEAAQKP